MSEKTPSSKVILNRAKALERNHQIEEAKELYQRILRKSPNNKKAQRALAALNASSARAPAPLTEADFNRVLALAESDLQRAETEAARLCRLHTGQAALENLHGAILVRMGAHSDAVEAFVRALGIEPGFTDAVSNLAAALGKLNRNEEAAKLYEGVLSRNSHDPETFYNYGNILRKLGRSNEAINAYKHALNLRPLYPAAYNNMGNAFNELGNAEQARTCFENVLEIDPSHDKGTRNLALAYATARQFKTAHNLYQRLLSRNPQDVDALLGAATCLINDGDQESAIEALQRIVKLDRSAPGPQFLLDALRGNARDFAPVEHTQGLFDGYADRFEQDLVVNLEYRIPTELRDLLAQFTPAGQRYSYALDVGCGTGLMGEAIQSMTDRLVGIDLSPAMLAKAREKDLYETLLVGDAVELIHDGSDTFDLVLCGDTLPYIGDLMPLFTALAEHTAPGAPFLCTTELAGSGKYKLQTTARFAHSQEYVQECASAAGFETVAQKTAPLRKDRGSSWITGGIHFFTRRA